MFQRSLQEIFRQALSVWFYVIIPVYCFIVLSYYTFILALQVLLCFSYFYMYYHICFCHVSINITYLLTYFFDLIQWRYRDLVYVRATWRVRAYNWGLGWRFRAETLIKGRRTMPPKAEKLCYWNVQNRGKFVLFSAVSSRFFGRRLYWTIAPFALRGSATDLI